LLLAAAIEIALKLKLPALLFVAALLAAGCGQTSGSVGSAGAKFFPDEPLKGQWQSVSDAMRTNGYVAAITTLRQIQRVPLSPDQLSAVMDDLRAINAQMYSQIAKGDANASNAMAELKRGGR
jgi:hypothetical protein